MKIFLFESGNAVENEIVTGDPKRSKRLKIFVFIILSML
jgi:hypothetical protein